MDIHPTLLNEIDAVELGASNRAWREAVRTAGWRIHGDRQRLAAESWRATVDADPDHTLQGIGDRGIIDATDALHSDLIVRIGGFSAYFVQLSNEIQDDVIYRSELSL